MATFVVTNTNDNGDGSLRNAIALAGELAGEDTILFDSGLSGETIELTSGVLEISDQEVNIGSIDSNVTIDANGSNEIFFVESSATISGLTLTGGGGSYGRAINNEGGLELNNVTISDNSDDGIRNRGGLIVNSSVITGNGDSGIYSGFSSVEVNNSEISGNGAFGIANEEGDLVVKNSIISNNGSDGINGVYRDRLTLENSTVSFNGGNGVSSNVFSGSGKITNSTISGNNFSGVSTFYTLGTLTIQNTTIADNGAGFSGFGSADILNSTIANNDDYGISTYLYGVTVVNSIVADNGGSTASGLDIEVSDSSGAINVSNSVISTVSDINDLGGNLLGVDPQLDPDGLADNGGPTLTIALSPDSPAIDAGSNPDTLLFDQRGNGFSRTVGAGTDIGAFEVQDVSPISSLNIGLFDADTDTLITMLDEGSVVFASEIAGRNLNIAALVPDDSPFAGEVESAFLDLNNGDVTRRENSEPYSLFGDVAGDFFAGSLPTGRNTISFDLFSDNGLRGDLLGTVERTFTIADDLNGLDIGLFDADTNERIATLLDGAEISATQLTNRNVNIAAFVPSDSPFANQVESVFLDLNDGEVTRTENSEPYALFGDVDGNFFAGSLPTGLNTISFDLFSDNRLRGDLIGTVDRTFTINDDLTGLDIGLFDADTNERIATLFDGAEIEATQLADRNVNIAAFIPSDSPFANQVESVFLNLNDGAVTRTENSEPYALFGDVAGDFFRGTLDSGNNSLEFELYSENRRRGDLIDTIAIDFSIA